MPKTLRDVLVKCNYTWNPRIKAISDWHSGQNTCGKLGTEYETVTPKIKLNQHLLEQVTMAEINDESPVMVRGQLTRAILARKIKNISYSDVTKRMVHKPTSITRDEVRAIYRTSQVKPRGVSLNPKSSFGSTAHT